MEDSNWELADKVVLRVALPQGVKYDDPRVKAMMEKVQEGLHDLIVDSFTTADPTDCRVELFQG